MSPVSIGTRSGDSHTPMDRDVDSSADEDPDLNSAEGTLPSEKLACQRCRRRKIRCDRIHPCTHCIKARSECLYESAKKPRAKKKRGLISSVYESKMELVSNKIDYLTEMMTRLSDGQLGSHKVLPQSASESRPQDHRSEALAHAVNTNNLLGKRRETPMSEHDSINSPLFAHALMATKFLQDTVDTDLTITNVATEMKSVLEALRSVVDSQRRQNDAPEQTLPFMSHFPPGTSTTDLPVPPLVKIMACLRVAQEHQRVLFFWPRESTALGDFTEYVIKVCSPGPVTDADLIIVHAGLHWLFSECSGIMIEDEVRQDFQAQALICRQSLEMVISNLSFHVPTTIDHIYAMYLAALYCFHKSKPLVAWDFISKASLMAQGLGLHNIHHASDKISEENRRKDCLFWAIYGLEKSISLRLLRASTIRDHDITIPKPKMEHRPMSVLHSRLATWNDAASLYGRLYDELFSPRALSLPLSNRVSSAQALAVDWRHIMAKRTDYYKQLEYDSPGDVEHALSRFLKHADSACDHAMLTAIHRCIPSEDSLKSGISAECLSSARTSLREHVESAFLLSDETPHTVHVDLWTNGALLLLPIIPFSILFCNIVETADGSDLQYLQGLVEALEALSRIPRYSSSTKQPRIFGALFNVASKYVEIKAKSQGLDGNAVHQMAPMHVDDACVACPTTDIAKQAFGGDALGDSLTAMQEGIGSKRVPDNIPPPDVFQHRPDVGESQDLNDFGIDLDPLGTHMGNWFQESNDMMNFLLDG